MAVRDGEHRRRKHVRAKGQLRAFAGVDEKLEGPVPEPVGKHAPAETPHQVLHLTHCDATLKLRAVETSSYSWVRFFYVFQTYQVRPKPMSFVMTTATCSFRIPRVFAFCSLLTVAVACGGGQQAGSGGPPGGGMPPMPVEIVTLTAKPVEQTSEFVASLKSRSSTTIQPEVEGFITRIAARSGQRVDRGALLFEIDSAPEQAALGSLQSMRPMREAEVDFARQQVERNTKLLAAGAISAREVGLPISSSET